jgi:hypothetical protein
MRNWSRNGASRQAKRCENPFVLSAAPLPQGRSNQTDAKPLTVTTPTRTALNF